MPFIFIVFIVLFVEIFGFSIYEIVAYRALQILFQKCVDAIEMKNVTAIQYTAKIVAIQLLITQFTKVGFMFEPIHTLYQSQSNYTKRPGRK